MTTPQKPTRTATSSEWTFNHRARPRYLSDSDSDSSHESDVDANPATKPVSDGARLMREMDLSGRHETVEYRPNPWSIARINAASRPLPKPALVPDLNPAILIPPKSKPKPIVEAFKKLMKPGDLRRDQPIIRDVITLRGGAVANKLHQGCMTPQVPQVRVEVPGPPPPVPNAVKPQAGSVLGTLQKEKPAHISNLSNRSVEPPAPRLFQPRQILSADREARSSPVRSFTRQSPQEFGKAVGNFRHSSPGAVSRIPVLADTVHRSSALPVAAPPCTNSRSVNTVGDPPSPSESPSPSPRPHLLESTSRGTVPSWLLNAIEEGIHAAALPPHSLVPTPRQDAIQNAIQVGSPHTRTSEPRPKRMPSPGRTPPNKKPRSGLSRSPDVVLKPPSTSGSRRRPNAYNFGEDSDPDAGWSTLARTKRKAAMSVKRAEKPMGIKRSGCFTLPLLGLAKPTARALDAKSRVITYLPPPMKLVNDTDDGPRASKNCEADEVATEEREDAEAVDIRMMDSDVTLVNEDEEDVAVIDVDDVCMHYPKTRAYMKAESRLRKMLGSVVELQL